MCKKCSIQHKCTLESGMCKKCSIQHKMYAREWDVQKVLYTAQCMLESGMCKKCSIQHKMYAVVIRIIILKEVGLEGGREQLFINNYVHLFHAYNYSSLSDGYTFFEPKTLSDLRIIAFAIHTLMHYNVCTISHLPIEICS